MLTNNITCRQDSVVMQTKMELRVPKKKRVGSHIKPQPPFPICIESEDGIPSESALWPLYVGTFNGDCVVVYDPDEMTSLYTMGFFGKGSFSRGYPSFGLTKKGIPPVIKERQWKRRKCWIDKIKQNSSFFKSQVEDGSTKINPEGDSELSDKSMITDNPQHNKDPSAMDVDDSDIREIPSTKNETENVKLSGSDIEPLAVKKEDSEATVTECYDQVLVLADSDDEDMEKVIRDPQPHLEDEVIKTVVETLNLTLEEAFFLSYALGCLQVVDITGQLIPIKQLWQMFCNVKPGFIESYVAYHYFRAKGWVVKSGFKFGGDFLLYKQGPAFYHASYVVLVERVDHELRRHKETLTWTKLHGLNRLAENSGKDIITCQVVFPEMFTEEDLKTPKSLPKFQVNEVLTKRWISSQEREDKDQI